jgi:hypothetical protein
VEGVMDLFDIPPKQRKLSLHRVRHFPTIRRCRITSSSFVSGNFKGATGV